MILFNYFLFRVGRTSEAKDAAMVALKSPWWTLGCAYQVLTLLQLVLIVFQIYYFPSSDFPLILILVNPDQEVAGIAQWEDEQIEYIKEKVSEEGRQEDLKKGKAAAQVPLQQNKSF